MVVNPKPSVRRSTTRVICALLAIGGAAALVALCAKSIMSEAMPGTADLVFLAASLAGIYIFARYAYLGHG